jgi:hypothetical protein
MGSVFAHLLDTMPFVVGVHAARRQSGASGDMSAAQIWPYIQAIPKTADHTVPGPPVPSSSTDRTARRLWSFSHAAGTPNRLSAIRCRVRDTGYKTQVVLDSLEWGELSGSTIHPRVRVVTEDGRTLNLPLEPRFVHSKYIMTGGWMGEGESHWFPLEVYLDQGLVIAFAYDIAGDTVNPFAPAADDPSEAALQQYLGGPGGCSPDSETDRWVRRAMNGDFMPRSSDPRGSRASVATGGTARVTVTPPRVLVAIAFSVARERPDFEPGGIVGMARMKPHVMIRATIPMRSMHLAAKFTRPARTTALDQGDGTVPGNCCEAYPEIKNLLVADMNENPWGPNEAFKPFWSGTFSYYEVDPERRLRDHVLHVVRRSFPSRRTVTGCGVRDLPDSPEDLVDIEKLPRQGEFDNIHVAPRLRLNATHMMDSIGDTYVPIPIDPARMRLDPIAMAPFCSHDCFHMHWRWSPEARRWSHGWGDTSEGPYAVPGAPLVPANHDVDLVIHGPSTFSYVEHAHPTRSVSEDATRTIRPNAWQYFLHAGAAYAQGVVDWRNATRLAAEARTYVSSRAFWSSSRRMMTSTDTPAVLYWNLRFFAHQGSQGYEAREWLQISQRDVDRARWG